jgi:hypothetical protein
MIIEIFKDNDFIDMSNLSVTDFGDFVQSQIDNRKDMVIDFKSINVLKGEKIILEELFQIEKKEQLN